MPSYTRMFLLVRVRFRSCEFRWAFLVSVVPRPQDHSLLKMAAQAHSQAATQQPNPPSTTPSSVSSLGGPMRRLSRSLTRTPHVEQDISPTPDLLELSRLLGQDPNVVYARKRPAGIPMRNTPLMCAATGGHVEAVRLLLDRGASVNLVNEWGQSALYLSSRNGAADVVALLLQRGADPSVRTTTGWTPLMAAVMGGHYPVVKLLLEHGSPS